MLASELIKEIEDGKYNERLLDIYVDESLNDYQHKRYINAINKFISLYGDKEVSIFSAPGRSEVGGNHTDHQHGCVLASSINLDCIAVVSKSESIKILSEKFEAQEIFLDDLTQQSNEIGTSKALVKGVIYKLKELGYKVGGFEAYTTSDVLMGAGLSSSAAFETIIGTIISGLYNDMKIDSVEIGKVGQYAENVFFGKPCGLMDQCACSVGGLISIDFNNPENPIVHQVKVDFSEFNHSLCIVDTKANHADLTDEYAAVPSEMKQVARCFNKQVLRDVDEEEFYDKIDYVRLKCHDRAVLRAIHFFNETKRPSRLVESLENKNFTEFKKLIQESGDSSYKYLQNVYANSDVQNQAVSIALCMSEMILGDHGVCRVHGGGFAGTIQAFVEDDYVATYKEKIEKVFGKNSCHILKITKYGGIKVI